jgi:hypothetical protein
MQHQAPGTQIGGSGATAYPTAPAAPAPAPPVWSPDSGFNNDVDFAQRQFDQGNADINTDESKIKYEFGFDDPTNPFSRVNEAKKQFLANARRTGTVFGSMNGNTGIFSGANARAIQRNTDNEARGNAALRAAYAAALEGIRRRRTDANFGLEEAKRVAYQNSYGRQFG